MPSELGFPRHPIMNAAVDDVTMAEALDLIDRFVAERTPRVIVTVNVDHLMLMRRDLAFREAYARADLITCDSTPLKWALAFLGTPIRERVPGADLFPAVAERAARVGHRLFYLGAAPGVAERAAETLRRRHPGLQVVGTYSPPVMAWEELGRDEETLRRVEEARPDILFAAFGAPKQELWLDAVRDRLRVPVGIGVGGAFDFAAGETKRAPRWMQRAGLEWSFRLAQEPGRLWRRYLCVDSRFIYHVLIEKCRGRKAAAPSPPPAER
ncbi:MAG: WecB/TagA/CpsF family glycosyltransferase [Candidatus Coatesbacteria bacterium]|nr:MAG: WecB/TagA/CpsF family glycosyltransferase [Candidatus Coatesbacteria bacterium]